MFNKLLNLKDLYYTQSSDELQYNANGQGEFDLDRLSEAEQFRSISCGQERKKKTLIYYDVFGSSRAWFDDKDLPISEMLLYLVKQGFEVYVPDLENGNTFQKLSPHDRERARYCRTGKPRSLEQIQQITPELSKKPKEALLRIDRTLLKWITYEDDASYYYCHPISDIANLVNETLSLDEIKAFLSRPNDSTFTYYVDTFDERTLSILKETSSQFPRSSYYYPVFFPIKIDLRLNLEDLDWIKNNIFQAKSSLQYQESTLFFEGDLGESPEKAEFFIKWIEEAPSKRYSKIMLNLEGPRTTTVAELLENNKARIEHTNIEINIINNQDLDDLNDPEIQADDLFKITENHPYFASRITSLTLRNSKRNQNAQKLISCLNLKELIIESGGKFTINEVPASLSELERLKLNSLRADTQTLVNLIRSSSKIKELSVILQKSRAHEPFDFNDCQLTELEILSLDQDESQRNSSGFTLENFIHLTMHSTKLRAVHLDSITLSGISEKLSMDQYQGFGRAMYHVETVSLKKVYFNDSNDKDVFRACIPNVHELPIALYLDDESDLIEGNQWPNIYSLKFEDLLEHHDYQETLKSFPNVTCLSLSFAREEKKSNVAPLIFPFVKDLRIINQSLINSESAWEVISKSFPNLERLEIAQFNIQLLEKPEVRKVFLKLSEIRFEPVDHKSDYQPTLIAPKLKIMRFSMGNISAVSLINLLESCPNLEQIHLQGSIDKYEEFKADNHQTQTFPYLKNIRTTWIEDDNVPLLKNLIERSPRFEELKGISMNSSICEFFRTLFPHIGLSGGVLGNDNGDSYRSTDEGGSGSCTYSIMKENEINFDTENAPQTYKTSCVFVNRRGNALTPNHERHQVFDKVFFKEGKFKPNQNLNPFSLAHMIKPGHYSAPLSLPHEDLDEIFSNYPENEKNRYVLKGVKELNLNSDHWVSIPARTPDDELLGLAIHGLKPHQYLIRRDNDKDFYEVRVKKSIPHGQYLIEYIITIPMESPTLDPKSDLYKTVFSYRTSNEIKLKLPWFKKSFTAHEIMQAYQNQKAGACRHKAMACMHEVQGKFPDAQVRIVWNNVHAFIEVCTNPHAPRRIWASCDLGGISSEIILDNSLLQQSSKSKRMKRPEFLNPAFDKKAYDYPASIEAFIDQIKTSSYTKIMIDIHNDSTLDSFSQAFLTSTRSCFMVKSHKDLNCRAKRTKLNDDQVAEELPGPCGPLYRFLTENTQTNGYLLIDLRNFTSDQIVQFNPLLDTVRKVDGIIIPHKIKIILLTNTKHEGCQNEADMTSRLDLILTPPYSIQSNKMIFPLQSESEEVFLFNSPSWRTLLVGRMVPSASQNQLRFEPGPLIHALRQGKRQIILCNPPLEDKSFKIFLDQLLYGRHFYVYENKITLPDDFNIILDTEEKPGPNLTHTVEICHDLSKMPTTIKPLTVSSFNQFFQAQEYDFDNRKMHLTRGWIEQAGGFLSVYLASPLTKDQWARLNRTLALSKKRLTIYPNPSLSEDHYPKMRTVQIINKQTFSPQASFYVTENPEEFVRGLRRNRIASSSSRNDLLIIDCSDLSPSDLFIKTRGQLKGCVFSFETQEGAALTALRNGTTVILTGELSSDLRGYLVEFMLNPATQRWLKQLVIVTNKTHSEFNALTQVNYPKTQAPSPIKPLLYEGREQAIKTSIAQNKVSLLLGKTGSGKTTTLNEHFPDHFRDKLKWAQAKPMNENDYLILFVDEFNIKETKKHEYTEFSGLTQDPPFIILNGVTMILTPQHRVVCAGNHLSCGGDRYDPLYFKKYPYGLVLMSDLPSDELRTHVLKPILGGFKNFEEIANFFIQIYLEIRNIKTEATLITPRELVHLAQFYLLYSRTNHSDLDLAKSCAHAFLENIIPTVYYSKLKLKSLSMPLKRIQYPQTSRFIVTKSRVNLATRLNESIEQRNHNILNQITGGLGGVILEGEPGIGKSEFVVELLLAKDFHEGHLNSITPKLPGIKIEAKQKTFYRVPVRWDYENKEKILIRAFHEGAVVIIDEINSSSTMERLLNELLSGKHEGRPPDNPGFTLIGTQNPVTYNGRREFSEAMLKRLLVIHVPVYESDEMEEILRLRFKISPLLAKEVVRDSESAAKKANTALIFRLLIDHLQEALDYICETAYLRLQYMEEDESKEFLREVSAYREASHSSSSSVSTKRPVQYKESGSIRMQQAAPLRLEI